MTNWMESNDINSMEKWNDCIVGATKFGKIYLMVKDLWYDTGNNGIKGSADWKIMFIYAFGDIIDTI